MVDSIIKKITMEQFERMKNLGLRKKGTRFEKIIDELLNEYEKTHNKKDIEDLFEVN